MAIGDAADAAGMEVLAGTEDLRESYIEHNRTRDYLADHQASGTHSADAINAGVFDLARIPSIPGSKVSSTISQGVDTVGFVRADGGLISQDVYDRNLAGGGGYRATYADTSGRLGYVPSSRRFKTDIDDADIPRATLRELRIVFYRYLAAEGHEQEAQPVELGLIAEEVHDLGLTFLVDYDVEGMPLALKERALPFLALLLAQDAEDRVDTLTRTVYDIQAEVLKLRDGVK